MHTENEKQSCYIHSDSHIENNYATAESRFIVKMLLVGEKNVIHHSFVTMEISALEVRVRDHIFITLNNVYVFALFHFNYQMRHFSTCRNSLFDCIVHEISIKFHIFY